MKDNLDDPIGNPKPSRWRGFNYFGAASQSSRLLRHQDADASPGHHSLTTKSDSLAERQSGDRIRITALNCGDANSRLMGMGLIPGAVLEIISCSTTGSVIVALHDQRLGVGAEMAHKIQVIDAEQPLNERKEVLNGAQPATVKLRDVAIGATLRVVGYEPTARDYKRKLLAMGLTPGTEVRVTRHAPLGDPTEIAVRGFQLSLRKAEADALIVEPVSGS